METQKPISIVNKPGVYWFTGLSGSGKTTIARKLADRLKTMGTELEFLDGDEVRDIFPSTGFTREARNEHIKRIGYLASKLEKHNVSVVAAFISPYEEGRSFVRQLCRNYIEIYLSTSLEECIKRDPKGLYKRALQGEITNFTGIDSPYETPIRPDILIDTRIISADKAVEIIIAYIANNERDQSRI
ncbi:MAG: adenylyl-sulfate kinase [Marinilabiliaceae bacterium]|jgi:adenylylsulfate kinase|nr:adenylyl-sulfate kinase [Marinilabiliaceae bacterium]